MTHNDRRHNRERYEPEDMISKCDTPITTVRAEGRCAAAHGPRRSQRMYSRGVQHGHTPIDGVPPARLSGTLSEEEKNAEAGR